MEKHIPVKFYHVLAALGEGKAQMLFSDLSRPELFKEFVTPYKRGKTFFAGSQLVNPADIKNVHIIETSVHEDEARGRVNRESLAQLEELSRTSSIIFLSAGTGYQPEDLIEAGADVTREYLKGGPGSASPLLGISKSVLVWMLGIVAAVVSAGVAKWFGLA